MPKLNVLNGPYPVVIELEGGPLTARLLTGGVLNGQEPVGGVQNYLILPLKGLSGMGALDLASPSINFHFNWTLIGQ